MLSHCPFQYKLLIFFPVFTETEDFGDLQRDVEDHSAGTQ